MRAFLITAPSQTGTHRFTHFADTSGRTAEDVAAMYDEPCGVTVIAGYQ